MKKLITLLFFSITLYAHAQFVTGAGAGNNVLMETQYTSVDGSPYLFVDWKNGGIRDINGKVSENLMIRYDSYRDEVQFLKDGRTLVVEPALTSEFYFETLNEETKRIENILFKNGFSIDGRTKLGYYQVLYNGKVQFIRKVKTNYIEETVNNFGTNEQVKKFVRTEEEFLVQRDGSAVAIGKSRKDIVSNFGGASGDMKAYIKENKLSVKDNGDLAKILMKYEELTSK